MNESLRRHLITNYSPDFIDHILSNNLLDLMNDPETLYDYYLNTYLESDEDHSELEEDEFKVMESYDGLMKDISSESTSVWEKVMSLKSKDMRHKGIENTLREDEIITIVATAEFFGEDTDQIVFDLMIARYRVFDWIAMGVMGRMNPEAAKVFAYSFIKCDGDINEFIEDLRTTDYDVNREWEALSLGRSFNESGYSIGKESQEPKQTSRYFVSGIESDEDIFWTTFEETIHMELDERHPNLTRRERQAWIENKKDELKVGRKVFIGPLEFEVRDMLSSKAVRESAFNVLSKLKEK